MGQSKLIPIAQSQATLHQDFPHSIVESWIIWAWLRREACPKYYSSDDMMGDKYANSLTSAANSQTSLNLQQITRPP